MIEDHHCIFIVQGVQVHRTQDEHDDGGEYLIRQVECGDQIQQ